MAALESCESIDESVLQGEIEILQAIYINELTLKRTSSTQLPHCVTVCLHPATADNTELQYVTLTLDLQLSPDYPVSLPEITIINPRGLSDSHLSSLRQSLKALAEEHRGGPMLYELIEFAKESLTEGNIPQTHCVICLGDFSEGDVFSKTACYHYFHDVCLHHYIQHTLHEIELIKKEDALQKRHFAEDKKEKKVVCPVCKEDLQLDDLANLTDESSDINTSGADFEVHITTEIRKQQAMMAQLFSQQKAKGGIIDLDEENNKFRLQPGTTIPLKEEAPKSNTSNDRSTELKSKAVNSSSVKRDPEKPGTAVDCDDEKTDRGWWLSTEGGSAPKQRGKRRQKNRHPQNTKGATAEMGHEWDSQTYVQGPGRGRGAVGKDTRNHNRHVGTGRQQDSKNVQRGYSGRGEYERDSNQGGRHRNSEQCGGGSRSDVKDGVVPGTTGQNDYPSQRPRSERGQRQRRERRSSDGAWRAKQEFNGHNEYKQKQPFNVVKPQDNNSMNGRHYDLKSNSNELDKTSRSEKSIAIVEGKTWRKLMNDEGRCKSAPQDGYHSLGNRGRQDDGPNRGRGGRGRVHYDRPDVHNRAETFDSTGNNRGRGGRDRVHYDRRLDEQDNNGDTRGNLSNQTCHNSRGKQYSRRGRGAKRPDSSKDYYRKHQDLPQNSDQHFTHADYSGRCTSQKGFKITPKDLFDSCSSQSENGKSRGSNSFNAHRSDRRGGGSDSANGQQRHRVPTEKATHSHIVEPNRIGDNNSRESSKTAAHGIAVKPPPGFATSIPPGFRHSKNPPPGF